MEVAMDRARVDDAPGLALDEVGRERLAHEEDRLEVDLVGAIPVFLRVVGERHPGRPDLRHQYWHWH